MSTPSSDDDYAKVLVERWLFNPICAGRISRYGRYFFYAAFCLIFGLGLVTTSRGHSWFLDDPRVIQLLGGVLFLWGMHMLAFKNDWAETKANLMKRLLTHAPVWAQSMYEQQTSIQYQRTLGSLAGVGALFIGAILFLFGQSSRNVTQFPPNHRIERPAVR